MSLHVLTQAGTYTPLQGYGGALFTISLPLAKIVDSTTTANTTYTCEALPGSAASDPVWRISKTTSAGVTTWANGNGDFANIAANRASLTYS